MQRITYPNYQIIVVNNGSTDSSIIEIKQWLIGYGGRAENVSLDKISSAEQYATFRIAFAGFIQISNKATEIYLILLESGSSLGYAGGNNVGIAWAMADSYLYALILSNDTTVEPEFVERMVEVVPESKASVIGALEKDSPGGKVLFVKSFYPAMLFYSEPQQYISDKKWRFSDQVNGEAMLICREGWANYHRYGNNIVLFRNLDRWVRNRIRAYIRGRWRDRGHAWQHIHRVGLSPI